MRLQQRPQAKATYRLRPIVGYSIAALVMGIGTFSYFNFGHSLLTFASTVNTFPYTESFEKGLGDWTQLSSDDIDWTRKSGKTPTGGTGPNFANDGSYYLFTEASSKYKKTALLESPEFDVSSGTNCKISFIYHMKGSHMGTLEVLASTDGTTWNSVWSKSGHQNGIWNSATVDLSAYDGQSSLTLRFSGKTGHSHKSDMAIDAINVSLTVPVDTDLDGIVNSIDIDDDNDGILDVDECPPQDTIRIGYFPDSRKHSSDKDYGYTFDGSHMINNSTPKLQNHSNFGPGGTVSNILDLVPISSNPLKESDINALNLNCIFIGDFTKSGVLNGTSSISTAELNAIKSWSAKSESNLVIVTQREQELAWSYTLSKGNKNPVTPTTAGLSTLIFNGPFGAVSSFKQGGSFQGKLSGGNGVVLATEATGKNVIILDNPTGDIILSDVDILTNLGGVSSGANINSANGNDVVFANIWAYAVNLITMADTDGDGLLNSVDLDSDNDGIWDAAEAGHSQSIDSDGRLTGASSGSGANGLYDALETSAESGIINYTIANSETSPDGIYDFLETDADGDGCYDVRESGAVDHDMDGIAGAGIPTVSTTGLVNGITYSSPTNTHWTDPYNINCISEICGNGIDDDKNGIVDDSSPGGLAASNIHPVLWFDASDKSTISLSGKSVLRWTDKSGNIGDMTVKTGSPKYTGTINNHTVINFTNDEMQGADAFNGSATEMHTFYVCRENTPSNNWLVSFNGKRTSNPTTPKFNSRFSFLAPYKNTKRWYFDAGNGKTNSQRAYSDRGITTTGEATLVSAYKSVTGGNNGLRINGASKVYTSANAKKAFTQDGILIGRKATDHDFAEIIAYETKLSASDEQKVASYLGLKYGITLGHDYISGNNVKLWDMAANTGYNKNIAGIGKDACSGLHQLRSSSLNPDTRITIQADSSQVQDGDFLTWGSDGGQMGTFNIHDFPPESEGRIGRQWKFTQVGNIGAIDLQFDLSNMGIVSATDIQLIIDTDNDGLFHDESSMAGGIRNGATDLGSNIYEFDNVTVSGNVGFSIGTSNKITNPLPIDLLSFDAELVYDQVDLKWSTASEIDNDFFTIERSMDMSSWTIIDKVKGAGNSTTVLEYSAYDDDPLTGISYYRLKQTDFNGDFTYSTSRTIRNENDSEAELELKMYPNPATDFTNIELGEGDLSDYDLMIINMAGQVERSNRIPSNTSTYRVNLSGLKTGTYIITIWKGEAKLQKKIIIEQY